MLLLCFFETFQIRTPERVKSKAKKERRLRTILVRNTTWLWLSRPEISPPISQHLVQLSSIPSIQITSLQITFPLISFLHFSCFFFKGHFFSLNRVQFPLISCIWIWFWNLLTYIHVHFSINRVCTVCLYNEERENKGCQIDRRPKWDVFSVAYKKEAVCHPYYKKQRKTVDWHCPQFSR